MEKRECKLCFKKFSNGRALGGHMKSHMAILQTPPKIEQTPPQQQQLGNETDSSSSSSEGEEEDGKAGLYYGLRENPKKSFRLVDPVFSSTMDVGSIVVDRESETESFKNPTRRRSKRNRIIKVNHQDDQNGREPELKKLKSIKPIVLKVESPVESEPVSSVSDNTSEEDLALCLVMLSRDAWMKQQQEDEEVAEKSDEEMDDDDEDDDEIIKFCPSRTRKKYQCESCKKVFKSYQALGGHRANHRKINGCIPFSAIKDETQNGSNAGGDQRFHKCPICFRIFRSRQALGGHKRIHLSDLATVTATTSTTTTTTNSTKFKDNLIDLNLPAPIEDDHFSQVDVSVVSDAEFVDPI